MTSYPQQFAPYPQQYWGRPTNSQAVAGMVFGIFAVIIEWGGLLTLALAVSAIICGAVGLSQSRAVGTGRGKAIAAVTLGITGFVLHLIWGVLFVGLFLLI
jgi:hypothetical protein